MGRKIVVTSGKGGVGKTSVVAGLGLALATAGKRVCVMDTDIGLNNLDVTLGVESSLVYDVTDVVMGRCRPRQALVDVCENLSLLPSCHGYENKVVTGQALKEVVNSLSATFDFVILDSPAGIEAGFRRAVSAVDEALVVSTPHITSLRDADKVISILREYQPEKLGLVVNRVRGDLELMRDNLSLTQISELLCCDVVGAIPDDDEVPRACGFGRGVNKDSKAGQAYEFLAEYVCEKGERIFDATDSYRGLFGGLKRKLRKIV